MFRKFSLTYSTLIFFIIIGIYCFLELLIITWGIPGPTHPFTYHMDEWHQLGSLLSLVRHFSSNTPGAAGGTIFHFLFSLGYVGVLYLLHIVNPRLITSSITQLDIQHTLFIFLRIETLLFGVGTLIAFYKIIRMYSKQFSIVSILLFILTPIWICLTNYFKYDIGLVFWQVMTMLFLLRYIQSSARKDFFLSVIFAALAFSTKVAAGPLFIMIIVANIFFLDKKTQDYKQLFYGGILYAILVLLCGLPDVLLNLHSRDSFFYFLYANILVQYNGFDYLLNTNWVNYLFFTQYPIVFGHAFTFVSYLSIFYWLYIFIKTGYTKSKTKFAPQLFIFVSFTIYMLSLLSIKLEGRGNRVLILLPFLVLLVYFTLRHLYANYPKKVTLIWTCIIMLIILQTYETLGWWSVKLFPDPRQSSSIWIEKNIPKGSSIAIENIPIYQMIPDITQKEVSYFLAKKPYPNKYSYQIYFKGVPVTADYVVITNVEHVFEKSSDKLKLLSTIKKSGYKPVAHFSPISYGFNVFADKKDFSIAMLIPIPTIDIYHK